MDGVPGITTVYGPFGGLSKYFQMNNWMSSWINAHQITSCNVQRCIELMELSTCGHSPASKLIHAHEAVGVRDRATSPDSMLIKPVYRTWEKSENICFPIKFENNKKVVWQKEIKMPSSLPWGWQGRTWLRCRTMKDFLKLYSRIRNSPTSYSIAPGKVLLP